MKTMIENGERSLVETPDLVHPPILIVGLGNPILGDDGVGWRVAERIKSKLSAKENGFYSFRDHFVEVDCLSLGGLSLMERLIGYEKVIIIDSITTGNQKLGQVKSFPLEELPNPGIGHVNAAHDTSLKMAIEIGRSLSARLPDQIMIVAIESQINFDFTENLSSEVELSVPLAERNVLRLLADWTRTREE